MGSFVLVGLLALVGFLPLTAAEEISGTKTVYSGETTTDYNFTGTSGVLNLTTLKSSATGATNADNHYRGTITTAENGSGKINVYGNKGQTVTSPGIYLYKDLSGFTGTFTIGEATSSAFSRDWVVFKENAKGSASAHWVFKTGTDSGVWAYNNEATFGSLSGSGIIYGGVTVETKVTVGDVTTADCVDVFDGIFTKRNNASNYTVEKTGAGTWIWTGNIITDLTKVSTVYASNQIGTLKITGGTLQIGDYGHEYTEANLYYAKGATGDGKLGKGVAGTGSVDVSAVLSTKYHTTATTEADSNPIQVTNATLAFGLAADTTITNAITSNSGSVSNVNPNTTITLSGVLAGSGLTFKSGKFKITGTTNTVTNLTVSAGELVLACNSGLSSATNVTVADDATLSIANAGQEIAKNLTLNAGSTLNFELSSDPLKSGGLTVETLAMDQAATVELSYDEAFLEDITPGLTLKVMNLTNENKTWDTIFKSAFAASELNNYFSIVQTGNSYSIAIDANKIPEPSAWLLLLLGIPFLRRKGMKFN